MQNKQIPIKLVTPEIAEKWLNNNKSNRKLRDGVVERYAEDMRSGNWTQCPMPICFYADGDVADGQHRLWAIIESGMAQEFPVVIGLSRQDGLNIDTGLNRSLVDNANISGINKGLSNELISVAKATEQGDRSNNKPLSNSEKLALVDKHNDAARWAISNGPRGKGLRNAVILAAIARAWYHETDHNRLRRFADVFTSGFADDMTESAAIALRNYFIARGSVAAGNAGLWRDTFLKAQNCISYFMRGKQLTVIKRVSDEAYPLKRITKLKKAA